MKALVAMLLVLVVGGCAHRHAAPPAEMSGFLDDYALLREGGPNDSALVYRAPDANWSAYDKVLLEPSHSGAAGGSRSSRCRRRISCASSPTSRARCARDWERASASSTRPAPV